MPTASPDRSSPEDAPTASLPYDPEEWQRRLEQARAKREKVLQARATRQQRTAVTAAEVGEHLTLTAANRVTPKAPRPKALDRPFDRSGTWSDARTGADEPEAMPASARPVHYLRPALFGLVVGAVAGTALAGFGGIWDDIGGLQARLMPLSPFAAPPSADGPPMLAASPPRVPAHPPPQRSAPRALAHDARATIAVSRMPLLAPAVPVVNSPAIPAAMLLAGPPPTIPVPPRSSELPRPGPQPDIRPAFLESHDAPTYRSPRLVVPETSGSPAPVVSTAPPPRRHAVNVVVHAPDRIAPERRQEALSSLAAGDWSAQDAVTSPYTISETHVRYYHPQDRAPAQELAELFDTAARDFTSYSPSPDEGLLELWLAGQGTPRQARPVRTRAVAERATTSRRDLFTRIVDAVEGTSATSSSRDGRDNSAGGPSVASHRGGAASPSRPSSVNGGRADSSGRQTSAGTDGRDHSPGSAANSSGSSRGASSGKSGSDAGRGNDEGRGSGGSRGGSSADTSGGGKGKGADNGRGGGQGGGNRGGSSADASGGGKGNGADNGRGGGRGGGSDRGGNGDRGGGGKGDRGR